MHRIEAVSQTHGDRFAVKDSEHVYLTYQEMAARFNSIAIALLAADAKIGSRIAVFQEPKADWICSLLAVMRIGAIYLPLDSGIPLVRLAAIVHDC